MGSTPEGGEKVAKGATITIYPSTGRRPSSTQPTIAPAVSPN